MKAIGRQSFLIVFDFDHTVVDCNTDEVIPAALNPLYLPLIQRELKLTRNMQWTKVMDTVTSIYTREEMMEATKKGVVLDPDMPAVFEYLLEAKYRYQNNTNNNNNNNNQGDPQSQHRVPEFLEINIASDANTMFIDASLDAVLPFVKPHLSQIHSNPYYELNNNNTNNKEGGGGVDPAGKELCYGGSAEENATNLNKDDEAERDALFQSLYEAAVAKENNEAYHIKDFTRKSRVCWYEPKGHDCPCCHHRGKPNMCKTKIIQRIMNTTKLLDYTIIFVGDGTNDYCPILNLLRPRDYMFARRDFPIHGVLSTPLDDTNNNNNNNNNNIRNIVGGCCQIGLWKDAKELLQLFQTAIDHPTQSRLPTLARFRDLNLNTIHSNSKGMEEFRAVTLTKRCGEAIQRTIKALKEAEKNNNNNNSFVLSDEAVKEAELLIQEIVQNQPVRPLPGQYEVDQWLKNYAYVAEDTTDPNTPITARATSIPHPHPRHEDNNKEASSRRFASVAPRWGQLPWLAGEIYFYHLLWQTLLLHSSVETIKKAKATLTVTPHAPQYTLNSVSPYAMDHPFQSQQTFLKADDNHHNKDIKTDGFLSSPVMPHQTVASTVSLFTNPLWNKDGIVVQWQQPPQDGSKDITMERIPLSSILPLEKNNLIPHPPSSSSTGGEGQEEYNLSPYFNPYEDIFRPEKLEVTRHFIKTGHLTNMLLCTPWSITHPTNNNNNKEKELGELMCSWLLWGNGVDSSMFSPEELRQRLQNQDNNNNNNDNNTNNNEEEALIAAYREEELKNYRAKRPHIIQNDTDGILNYLEQHFNTVKILNTESKEKEILLEKMKKGEWVNAMDIVQDNTGVESVADMCFALWFLHNATPHHPEKDHRLLPRVTFHVKPMPYYISDVTPRDFALVLSLLDEEAHRLESDSDNNNNNNNVAYLFIAKEIRTFIRLIHQYLSSGQIRIVADTVWTMPSEIRELPPRVMNKYFYTQHIHVAATAADNLSPQQSRPLHQCNKDAILPRTALVVFKGDLNYRRVLGDRHWNRIDFNTTNLYQPAAFEGREAVTDFLHGELFQDTPDTHHDDHNNKEWDGFQAIMERYWPVSTVPVVVIRTMKSEVSAGVSQTLKVTKDKEEGGNPSWRTNGQTGVILFAH